MHCTSAEPRLVVLVGGSDAGCERAAIAYSILGSCRLAGVEPHEYLADVLLGERAAECPSLRKRKR